MSDSDDDWFEKDIEEMVQEAQKKKEPTALEQEESHDPVENFTGRNLPNFMFEDYGGNYEIPMKKFEANITQNRRKGIRGENEPISFKKLNFISDLSPMNVFLEITQIDCEFFDSFKMDLPDGHAVLMVKVLAKLCDHPVDEYKKEFLTVFVQSETFQKELKRVLDEAFIQKSQKQFQINVLDLLNDIIKICKAVHIKLNLIAPNCYSEFVKAVLDKLETAESKYPAVKREISKIYEVMMKKDAEQFERNEIYPTLDELKSEEVKELKPNIIEGKFDSVEHYLEVHKSLLKEDFVSPLRDIIAELRKTQNIDEISTSNVYSKVRFLLKNVLNSKSRKGEMLLLDLSPDKRTTTKSNISLENSWVNPKKLMWGSLLCFTSSIDFNDLILAVVSNRDIDMISQGYVQIEILKIYNILRVFETDFIMFESEVFFEPYHHVYRVLKGLDESNFPMANYIVNVEKNHLLPGYLKNSKKVLYEVMKHTFNPMKLESFPSEKTLKLNTSQLEAYKHALSNKFSLIQGPPGTGKTYIGLKIVSTLLTNVHAQILVICYTNHALDQFLSGILNTTDNIVRMGNQSKNELLDKYNIKQLTDSAISEQRLRPCFYALKDEYTKKLEELEDIQKDYDKSENCNKKLLKVQDELRKISRKIDEIKQISDYSLLKNKKVIGMTTTCAARCNLLLQLLKTPIVIVEEAAEVLESHIIASITKNTQHLILIGDHQQLRPTTSVYKLSQKYKMDISMFERMVNNNLNCVCLSTQHRMREEIANLLRPTIYKNLLDHETVQSYPNIKGVAKNLFFLTHQKKEGKSSDETTKRNVHEAKFLVALANYLILQGYQPEDIVLLTMYNGQMNQIIGEKKQFPNLQKVKVTVVDNFQGEESRIILLSLVRYNSQNRIGYLSMTNRICVSLSRAREGLYVTGNIDFLAENSSIWKEIKEKLELQEAVGDTFPLYCQRHSVTLQIKNNADFEIVKYGGCQEQCDFELPCGHKCAKVCHQSGFEHLPKCGCK